MNDSSITPTSRPFIVLISIDASETMVPIDIRCRCPMRALSTR